MGATNPLTPEKPSSYQAAEGEEYMSDRQLAYFRKMLSDWKQSLLQEADRMVDQMQNDSAMHPDINDRATQEEEFSLGLRTRDRERKLLRKIDETLARIENADYGYCDNCGIEIGLPRMQARPTATLCIDCKRLEEVREKQGNTRSAS
ncbi:MAG: RNA polymerase-binding protein DksA [Candidatus Contendobacter odensis]|uniref:RNA polymerase-binding transcription factor DksA n=1 Tax=Candidatus Contendibacter odensensis TaxID=1400860 RepID=A0A2G6PF92_9GAMM|nr:MAG: RNA polymerase-binding protein DksA [Candidatus Contendobacter odensis]